MKSKEKNISIGFKVSPVGRIPKDWEVKELHEIVDKFRSIRYGIVQPGEFDATGRYMVRGQDYSFGWVAPERLFRVSEMIETKYKNARLKSGDIILTIVGAGTGTVAIVPEWLDGANCTQTTARIAIEPAKASSEYLFQFLISGFGKKLTYENIKGGAQPGLNCGDIEKFVIPLPSLREQHAIAACLNNWDVAILKAQKLVMSHELRKKWLIQQLLSGKRRIRGFQKYKWIEIKLQNAFEFIKTYSISREGLTRIPIQDSIFCIHYGDIHAFYKSSFLDFLKQKGIPQILGNVSGINKKDYLQNGDVILADASEDYKGVGEVVEVTNLNKQVAVGGLHTIVLRGNPKILTTGFRGYLLSSETVRNLMRKMATGTSVYSITKSSLQDISLKIPASLAEQEAISVVLMKADVEIEMLTSKLNKLKAQKKGLRQILLTGKKRLTPK